MRSPLARKTQVVKSFRARLWSLTDLDLLLPTCGPLGVHLYESQFAHLSIGDNNETYLTGLL